MAVMAIVALWLVHEEWRFLPFPFPFPFPFLSSSLYPPFPFPSLPFPSACVLGSDMVVFDCLLGWTASLGADGEER